MEIAQEPGGGTAGAVRDSMGRSNSERDGHPCKGDMDSIAASSVYTRSHPRSKYSHGTTNAASTMHLRVSRLRHRSCYHVGKPRRRVLVLFRRFDAQQNLLDSDADLVAACDLPYFVGGFLGVYGRI